MIHAIEFFQGNTQETIDNVVWNKIPASSNDKAVIEDKSERGEGEGSIANKALKRFSSLRITKSKEQEEEKQVESSGDAGAGGLVCNKFKLHKGIHK